MTITPQMRDAQASVNRRFEYLSDQKQYGGEHYEIPTKFRPAFRDDCDGYAMEVAAFLKDYNRDMVVDAFKTGEFAIHRVITERGNGHAVLEVKGYYIDNIGDEWRDHWKARDGWTYDKKRTWWQIRAKLGQGWARENKGKALLLLIGVAALAALAVGGVF